MPNGDVVPITQAMSRAEQQAHDRWMAASAARLRAQADQLEHPSRKNQRALDAAVEKERVLRSSFTAEVRRRVAAEDVKAA